MNLKFIVDSVKIMDALKDYENLRSAAPNNFYFRLASWLAKQLRNPKYDNVTIEDKFGNVIDYKESNDGITVTINGTEFTVFFQGLKGLAQLVTDIYNFELRDKVVIKRPEGYDARTDRVAFNKEVAKGTVFPTLHESVKYSGYRSNDAVKQTMNKALAYNRAGWEIANNRKSFKPENFVKVDAPKPIYVKKDVPVFYIKGDVKRVKLRRFLENPTKSDLEVNGKEDIINRYNSKLPYVIVTDLTAYLVQYNKKKDGLIYYEI